MTSHLLSLLMAVVVMLLLALLLLQHNAPNIPLCYVVSHTNDESQIITNACQQIEHTEGGSRQTEY